MKETVIFEDALKRIEELEKENTMLRKELEYYENRKTSGRQKHNDKLQSEIGSVKGQFIDTDHIMTR